MSEENRKNSAAQGKPTMHCVPRVALWALGAAMEDGAKKYGKFNWRESSVDTDIFINALERHISAYSEGETYATDSEVHHLAHVMAGCAILLDAEFNGILDDKRFYTNEDSVYDGVSVYRATPPE
jgi:hypothetical protein